MTMMTKTTTTTGCRQSLCFTLALLAFTLTALEVHCEVVVELPPGGLHNEPTNNFVVLLKPGIPKTTGKTFVSDLKRHFGESSTNRPFISSYLSPSFSSVVIKNADKLVLQGFLNEREQIISKVEQSVKWESPSLDSDQASGSLTVAKPLEAKRGSDKRRLKRNTPANSCVEGVQGLSVLSAADSGWQLDVLDWKPNDNSDKKDDSFCSYSTGGQDAHVWVLDCGVLSNNTNVASSIVLEYV